MGQRHQVYVIARVRRKDETTGHRRCVAAYHHQWCYGRTALQLLSRFLKLISQPDNAQMIRREIANVQGNWGEVPAPPAYAPRSREDYVPCPFIAYLLQLSWNVNLDDDPVYVAGTTFSNAVLDARMETSQGDNNDGITVIDVTDPANPSYCFNAIGGPPLTAEQYVRQYYPQTVDLATIDESVLEDKEGLSDDVATERMVMQTISALEAVPLMSIDLLVEAWPREYTRARKKMVAAGTYVPSDAVSQDDAVPATSTISDAPLPPQPDMPSLAGTPFRKAVLHAASTGDIKPVEDSPSVPGQTEIALSALRELTPSPEAAAGLLSLVIGRDSRNVDALDLSDIELSPTAILGLVKAVGGALVKLDLTGNSQVAIHDLENILHAAPNLRQLTIFDCPLVSDEDIYGLLASSPKSVYPLEFIGHNAFFRRARDARPSCPYTPAFTCIIGTPMRGQPLITSLPYFTPSRLLRSLYTLLKPVAAVSGALTSSASARDPRVSMLALSGSQLFGSSALPHAAFTTWFGDAATVTDAIRVAEGQEPDPSGLRANTQRIMLIPQASTSWDGWLLMIQPPSYFSPAGFAIARKRPVVPSTDAEAVENAALDLEVFSFPDFIRTLEEEGRPAPPAEDVAALASVIESVFPADARFDSAGAVEFLKEAMMMSRAFGSF
ncbi:unnamed protein product [Peniophora sp. CBMAI 1063]|nr:unnamed protein product [Peniophora sp. CBMAI 1063]